MSRLYPQPRDGDDVRDALGSLYMARALPSGCNVGSGAPQVTFWNVQQLMDVKRELMPALRRNRAKSGTRDAYSAFGAGDASKSARTVQVQPHASIRPAVVEPLTAASVWPHEGATPGRHCHAQRSWRPEDSTEHRMSTQSPGAKGWSSGAPCCFAVIADDTLVACTPKHDLIEGPGLKFPVSFLATVSLTVRFLMSSSCCTRISVDMGG